MAQQEVNKSGYSSEFIQRIAEGSRRFIRDLNATEKEPPYRKIKESSSKNLQNSDPSTTTQK